MGKTKSKSKLRSLRSSPLMSFPVDLNEINDELLDQIMTKLKSGKPSDRHLGAEMVTNSISNFDNYKNEELIELVRILSPLCCDRAENVRYATIDSLCHLSSLSDKLCELMVESDVMTPVITLLNTFINYDWSESKKCKLVYNKVIYIDSCRLLTNLCGSSNKALKVFNNSNLSQILINGLKSSKACIEVSIASAQCLNVVVEENVIPDLLKEENIDLIKGLLNSFNESASRMHLSILVAFIVSNLSIKLDSEALNIIFNIINYTLSNSCLQQLKHFSQQITEFVENEKPNQLLNESYDELKSILLAKRLALELLTNMTSYEDMDNEEDVMECDDNDSDEEDISFEHNLTNEDNGLHISPEFEKLILDNCIVSKIAEHLGSVDNEVNNIFIKHNFGKEMLSCIESVQECALVCIHNLVLCISDEKLAIDGHWNSVYRIAFNSNEYHLIEESTNTMRAIITRYVNISLTGDELERLCIVCHNKSASNSLKINVIKLMAVLAERSIDLSLIEKISSLLMTALENEVHLVIKAEIFDAFIDVFSEDHKTDTILRKTDLINKLKSAAVVFNKEVNKSRQILKQNPIISTVKSNLMPFIQYKEKMLFKDNV